MTFETSLATSLYTALREQGIAPEAEAPAGAGQSSFSDALAQAAEALETTLRSGEEAAKTGASGGADLQGLVEALTATELALETAVVVRDRVVEAYQEILRMPV